MTLDEAIQKLIKIRATHGDGIELWYQTHDRHGNPCFETVDFEVAHAPEKESTKRMGGWHGYDGEKVPDKIVLVG